MGSGFLQLIHMLPSEVFILQRVLCSLYLRVNTKIGRGAKGEHKQAALALGNALGL